MVAIGQGSKMKPPVGTSGTPVSVTNNAAPFSFNSGTQILNVPKQDKLENNGNNTMKFTRGDGISFDSIQVYLIPEPDFCLKFNGGIDTLFNSTQSFGYTQGGMTKILKTIANIVYNDTLGVNQTIKLPDPTLLGNGSYGFSLLWGKIPNQVTFDYPIYDRQNGVLYSSSTFVVDIRDYSTLTSLTSTDVLFKSRPYSQIYIQNINGKYFIQR